jgi:hypothetical protein
MALDIWSQDSGYSFGLYQERTKLAINLPVTSSNGITFNLISGKLPPGLRISGNQIIGTPFDVPRVITFEFCIRASDGASISDRTFYMDVAGPDTPTILTPAGALPVGPSQSYFALDQSYIEFQISAIDFDTAVGQRLTFFIGENDGVLPPGLSMNDRGLITGFIEPAFAIKITDGDGSYDNGLFDGVVYDFGSRPSNGYNTYLYDQLFYDYNIPTNPPKKINRNYEFVVSVSDGDTVARQKFRMFVVADDFFRSDNTYLPAGSGVYKADGTFLRSPVWSTPAYLGIVRANNYITKLLDIYESHDSNPVIYDLVSGELPPGMQFDVATAEIFGTVPYQPAVSIRYTFTVSSTRFTNQINETATTNKTFYIDVQGEIDSVIHWNTPADLGTVAANFISNLRVSASTTVENAVVGYTFEGGRLPPGLDLMPDGEIVGKVVQYGTPERLGLTRFYDTDTGFNSSTTQLSTPSLTPLFGSNTVFTATIAPIAATGFVEFLNGSTVIGTASVINGIAEFVYSQLTIGKHYIRARYMGDNTYRFSVSAPLTVTVNKAFVRTQMTSSATSGLYGADIGFSVTVTSPSGYPTGSVSLHDGVNTISTLDIADAVSGYVAFDTRALVVGTHTITAVYNGNANYAVSTSNAIAIRISPQPGTTPITVILSFSTLTPRYGLPLTVTARFTPSTATGSVIFKDGNNILGSSVISAGAAVFRTTALTGGSHTISAIYSGNLTYVTTETAGTNVIVSKINTAVSFVTSSSTPNYGEAFALSATITASFQIPTGTVTFKEGSRILGIVPMYDGTASFTTNNRVSVGSHSYTAEYNGDSNYNTSVSYAVPVTVLATSISFSANSISSSASAAEEGGSRSDQSATWTIQNETISLQGTGLPYHSYGNVTDPNTPTAQNYNVAFPYRGGTLVAGKNTPVDLGVIGFWLNGVAMFDPSAGNSSPSGFAPVDGFHYNASSQEGLLLEYSFGEDAAGGRTSNDGIYHYSDSNFFNAWATGNGASNGTITTGIAEELVIPYLNDGLIFISGHSKLLGFAIDGYPVYGPYGYSTPTDSQGGCRRMISGYRLKSASYRAGTGAADLDAYPMGIFVEDYEFSSAPNASNETPDLDEHNGRYCLTPDYPNGTYAYFTTVGADNKPVYPYIIGNFYFGAPATLFGPPPL